MILCSGMLKTALKQCGLIIFIAITLSSIVNFVRSSPLTWFGDWSGEARAEASTGRDIVISLVEAKKLHQAGQAFFLDARPDIWFEYGHIKGARNLPWEQFDELYASVMADVPVDAVIIAYCDGEACELSHELAAALINKGYTTVRVLINGWTLWTENKLPVEGESS